MKQANLYIGAEKLDLLTGEVVAVTLTANNYEEPDKVNSSYTNTFKLPWTRQNIKAVGALMANERTDSQYAINDSLLRYDAIDVFGSLHIFEGNPNEAEAAFISGIAQFFDDLGDATLWCLFNSNTFANTRAGYIGELTNTYTDGYTTALASFSTLPTDGTDININRLYPFPFYWKLFNDIATYAGWTVLDTGLLADLVFRKTAIAYNGEQYNEQLYFSYFGASWGFSAGTAPGNYLTANPTVAKPLVYNQRFGNISPFIAPTDFRYDSTADCGGRIYELYINSIDITTDAGSYDFDIRIAAFSGNTFVTTLATYSSGLITGAGATVTLPALTLLTDWNTEANTIQAQMRVNVGLNVVWKDFTFRFCDGRDNGRDLIWGADDVMPYCSLPNLKMTEFIKGVCKQFGAIPKVDGLAKTISFVKFQTIAQDFAGAAVWSGKIDQIEKIEWKYGEYGKINNAVYDNDEEMPETYARGQMLVGSANLPEVYEWLKLPFSASLQVNFADGLINFAYIPVYDPDGNKQKLKPRCVHILFEDVATVGIVDNSGTTNVTQYNLAEFARNQDDYTLSFAGEKGLLAFYHYSFAVMIGRMYKLTATFALTANDFAGLNFFAPVFISQRVGQVDINGWFILQEVKEWDGRSNVECELLKIEFE